MKEWFTKSRNSNTSVGGCFLAEAFPTFNHTEYVCLFSYVRLACTIYWYCFVGLKMSFSDILLYSCVVSIGFSSLGILPYCGFSFLGEFIFRWSYFFLYECPRSLECGSILIEYALFHQVSNGLYLLRTMSRVSIMIPPREGCTWDV